jgi:phosphatidylinositol glycan class N
MMLAQNLRTLALKGLQYFQTYDWLMLMTVITLGYIGWIICLLLHILQSYTPLADVFKNPHDAWQRNNKTKVISKKA